MMLAFMVLTELLKENSFKQVFFHNELIARHEKTFSTFGWKSNASSSIKIANNGNFYNLEIHGDYIIKVINYNWLEDTKSEYVDIRSPEDFKHLIELLGLEYDPNIKYADQSTPSKSM